AARRARRPGPRRPARAAPAWGRTIWRRVWSAAARPVARRRAGRRRPPAPPRRPRGRRTAPRPGIGSWLPPADRPGGPDVAPPLGAARAGDGPVRAEWVGLCQRDTGV